MFEKVALVTGGSKGIGAAVCKELSKAGYFVYINCRNKRDDVNKVLEEILEIGGHGKILEFDVGSESQIETALENFGHSKLDLLVNNAGMLKDNLLYQIELPDWNNIININFWGAVNMFNKLRSRLMNSENAALINIGSIAGIRPRKGQGVYAISKAMMIEWSRAQAQAGMNRGIRFYTISPGPVATDMIKSAPFYKNPDVFKRIPLGRFAEPEEVAETVLLLAETGSLFENGSNIILDGGLTQASND